MQLKVPSKFTRNNVFEVGHRHRIVLTVNRARCRTNPSSVDQHPKWSQIPRDLNRSRYGRFVVDTGFRIDTPQISRNSVPFLVTGRAPHSTLRDQ